MGVVRRAWQGDVFATMVGLAVVEDVFYAGPVVIGAVTGRTANSAVETIVAAVVIVVTVVLLREILTTRTSWTPPVERSELVEERRAWLADLRTEGAPWHERLGHKLSVVFIAAPVMTVRRWAAGTTLAQRSGGLVTGMGMALAANAELSAWLLAAFWVLASMLGDVTSWILTRRTTKLRCSPNQETSESTPAHH